MNQANTGTVQANQTQQYQPPQQSDMFESNLFGGDAGSQAPAPAPAPVMQQPVSTVGSFDHFSQDGSEALGSTQAPAPAPAPASLSPVPPVENQQMSSMPAPSATSYQPPQPDLPQVSTVDSSELSQQNASVYSNAPDLFGSEQNNTSQPPVQEYQPPAENPQQQYEPPQEQQQYQPPAPEQQQQYQPPAPEQQQQQYQAPPPQQYPYQQQQPPQTYDAPHELPQQELKAEAPTPGHHTRVSSMTGFNTDMVMGGEATPLPPDAGPMGMASPARAHSGSGVFGYEDGELEKIEEMKKKVQAAKETADDAEKANHKLQAEAQELRNDADKSEATARSLRAAASEKKKGAFGGGSSKKKKMLREAERASQDADAMRKRFTEVQGRANDAQAVAMETKREYEKLKAEMEQAEIDAAAAASMRQHQVDEQKRNQQQGAPAPSYNANGYAYQQQQQQPPPAYSGYGEYGGYQPPAPAPVAPQGYSGYDQQNAYGGGAFGGAMGTGGGDNNYANPFG